MGRRQGVREASRANRETEKADADLYFILRLKGIRWKGFEEGNGIVRFALELQGLNAHHWLPCEHRLRKGREDSVGDWWQSPEVREQLGERYSLPEGRTGKRGGG